MNTQMMKITIMILVFCTTSTALFAQQVLPKDVVITGYLKQHTASDTVMVQIHKEFGSGNGILPIDSILTQISKDGNFSFRIKNLKRPLYLTFRSKVPDSVAFEHFSNHELYQYPFEPGDSVHVEFDDEKKEVLFSGPSADKFRWLCESAKLTYLAGSFTKIDFCSDPENWYIQLESIQNLLVSNLDHIKSKLNTASYLLLRADLIANLRSYEYNMFNSNKMGYCYGDSIIGKRGLILYKQKMLQKRIDSGTEELLSCSSQYANYLLQKARADFSYNQYMKISPASDILNFILKSYPKGVLRDKIVTALLYSPGTNKELYFKTAINSVSSLRYRQMLLDIQSTTAKGQSIIESYVFKDKQGKVVKLSDFKGKVVFIDQWFTGCGGCVYVAKALPDVEAAFKGRNDIVFLSLSVDNDRGMWLKSISPNPAGKKLGYTHYTTESTVYVYTDGRGSDHPFIRKYNLTNTFPSLMIIDKKGRIFSSSAPRPDAIGGKEKLIEALNQALLN